jgi:hypothetical protein
METIIGIAILGIVGYTIYKMVSKKETPVEAVAETVAEVKKEAEVVVDKAREEIKGNIDAKTEEVFVKAMEKSAKIIDVPKESAELLDKVQEVVLAETKAVVEEPVKVVKKRTKKAAAAIVAPVVVAPVKKVRKKKVK